MVKDRILRYLRERKSSHCAKDIAGYFMCAKGTATTALGELFKEGLVSCVTVNRTKYYRAK